MSGRLTSVASLLPIAAAAGNLYGMLGVLVLLSYGLVDIPRSWWRSATVSRRLAAACLDTGRAAAEAEVAAAQLCRSVAIARATGALLPRRSSAQQRAMVAQLLSEVADVADAAHDAAPLAARVAAADGAIMDEAGQYIDDAAELASLRGRVHAAAAAFQRACSSSRLAFARGLRALEDDAALACDGAPPAWAPSAFRAPRTCCGVLRVRRRYFTSASASLAAPSVASEARWIWRIIMLPVLRRMLAAALAVLSLLIVVAEASTLAAPGSAGDLSAFSRLLRGPLEHHAALRALLSASVLGYVTAATFFTVFALHVFDIIRLAPHASDAPSLLAGAALLCRFAPPLVVNFFSFIRAENSCDRRATPPLCFAHTVFYDQIGRKLDAVPLFGAHAAAVFPFALLLFVALLAGNAFDRVLRLFRWKAADDGDADAAASQRGRELLEREEANVRAGLGIGLALLASSPGGEPAATATGPPAEQTAEPPSGPVMEALHRHSLRTGAPLRWTPRPLPPPLPPVTGNPLLSRLRQSAASARERLASAFRADEQGQQLAQRGGAEDDTPLLDASGGPSAGRSQTGAMLDAVFERIERGRK